MNLNDITFTVLENGTVRIDTDKISGPSHTAAEQALQYIAKELGGKVERTPRAHQHGFHSHYHTHENHAEH